MTRWNTARSVSANGLLWAMAALLTSTSMPPKRSTASATAALTAAASATSQRSERTWAL
ncbi:hypothetical protein D3C81_2049690 [compost metagenome]